MTEAETFQWKLLDEDQIVVPDPTRTMTALIDDQGRVLIVGVLIARGPDNHYVVGPQWGDLDYVRGKPARNGIISESHCQRRQVRLPRERRIQIADELLSFAEPHPHPEPGVLCFRKCQHNRYQVSMVPLRHRVQIERGEGIYYPKPNLDTGIKQFLEANNLICVERH